MLADFSESKDELINPLDNVKVLSIGQMNGIYPRITENSVEALSKPNGFQKMTPTNTGTFADLKMPSKTLFTQADKELRGIYPPNSNNKVSRMVRLKHHIIRPKKQPLKSH